MDKFNNYFCRMFFIFVWGTFYLLIPVWVQAADYNIDDQYLQSLSEEADHLEYMGEAEKELQATRQIESAPSADVLENTRVASTGIKNFEKILFKEYPYTYQLYKKLADNQKQQVFIKIKETKKLSLAQTMIINLYKSTYQ